EPGGRTRRVARRPQRRRGPGKGHPDRGRGCTEFRRRTHREDHPGTQPHHWGRGGDRVNLSPDAAQRAVLHGAVRCRAGAVTSTGILYGPGSAKQRFARATRCIAPGTRLAVIASAAKQSIFSANWIASSPVLLAMTAR